MAKKIVFKYKDKDYTLEYNRDSVRQMEAQGFSIIDIDSKPLTTISTLFAGAFLMHHRNVATNRNLCDEIYRSFSRRDELIAALVEMYQEPVLSLLDEPEDNEGNAWSGVD